MSFVQRKLEDEAPQFAQKNINLGILRDLAVPLPPLEMQDRFVVRLNSIRDLKYSCSTHLAKLDALFASLQERAFKGRL